MNSTFEQTDSIRQSALNLVISAESRSEARFAWFSDAGGLTLVRHGGQVDETMTKA